MEELLKNHFIAYFDILGYKSEVARDEKQFFKKVILGMISFHSGMETLFDVLEEAENKEHSLIKYKLFSDNFILYVPETKNEKINLKNLSYLMDACLNFQCHCCKCGLKLRGGITKGILYADKYFVFGSGLIKAVNLEENAKYPLILLDDIIQVDEKIFSLLPVKKNRQNVRYLNFLKYYLNRYIDKENGKENIKQMLLAHKGMILNMPFNRRVASKKLFLIMYHNDFCKKYHFEDQLICLRVWDKIRFIGKLFHLKRLFFSSI